MAGNVYSDPIIQGYGPSSNTSEPAYGGAAHFHQGVDYQAPYGTPVPAVAGGVVIPNTLGEYGYGPNLVLVQQPSGQIDLYGHMESSNVVPGQVIQPGQIIGAVGSEGNSSGPHLHLGLLSSTGQPLDPSGITALPGAQLQGKLGATDQGQAQAQAGGIPNPLSGLVGLVFGGVVRFIFTLVGLGVVILGFYILFGHPQQDIALVGKALA